MLEEWDGTGGAIKGAPAIRSKSLDTARIVLIPISLCSCLTVHRLIAIERRLAMEGLPSALFA
jgi:hypothetical protein